MPADNAAGSPPDTADQERALRVDCYVRSTVPGSIAEMIETVLERLQHLCDQGVITEYQVSQWPPECHAVTTMDDRDKQESPRHELVAEFEHWADQHGYSLDPAFCREEIPSSPLGIGPDKPRERIRVPFVALALYEDDKETETLSGVVPYTDQIRTDETRTCTVEDWLSAVETSEGEMFPPRALV